MKSCFSVKIIHAVTLLLSISFPFLSETTAQKLTVMTMDQENKSIPFVNIYSKSFKIGAITDINGKGMIDLSDLRAEDTLIFTCVSYEAIELAVKKINVNQQLKIVMSSKSYGIEEVEIISQKPRYKRRKVGYPVRFNLAQYSFDRALQSKGTELGVVMKNNKDCIIESISVNIAKTICDTATFELNIYELEDGLPGKTLNRERVFITIIAGKHRFNTNIGDQYIQVEGDFFVALESVDYAASCEQGGVFFKAKLGKNGQEIVKDETGKWHLTQDYVMPSIYCKLRCER